jgi:hypothetical protein
MDGVDCFGDWVGAGDGLVVVVVAGGLERRRKRANEVDCCGEVGGVGCCCAGVPSRSGLICALVCVGLWSVDMVFDLLVDETRMAFSPSRVTLASCMSVSQYCTARSMSKDFDRGRQY